YEWTTVNGVTGRNDDVAFASVLPPLAPGQNIDGLTFNAGDAQDWYLVPTPVARNALGQSQKAWLTTSMIEAHAVTVTSGGVQENPDLLRGFHLFAAADADGQPGGQLIPVENFTGVPDYYFIEVANSTPLTPIMYRLRISTELGATVAVPVSDQT